MKIIELRCNGQATKPEQNGNTSWELGPDPEMLSEDDRMEFFYNPNVDDLQETSLLD